MSTTIEMAKDLVLAQIAGKHIAPSQLPEQLHETYHTLKRLEAQEAAPDPDAPAPAAAVPVEWRRSITRYTIKCLECGATFKQLSSRHLRMHELDPRTYRTKYGIPSTQPLSSREMTARRRALADQIRPWEQAAKTPAKPARAASKRGQ